MNDPEFEKFMESHKRVMARIDARLENVAHLRLNAERQQAETEREYENRIDAYVDQLAQARERSEIHYQERLAKWKETKAMELRSVEGNRIVRER